MIDHRLPIYQQLRDEIARQIAAQVWRPGDGIPTEAELASSHRVSVGTVRKAIDTLVAEGLVERQQGRGTFVKRPSFDSSLIRFFRHQGLGGEGGVPESRILERQACRTGRDFEIARSALLLPAGEEIIRLTRLRLAGGVPFALQDIWLPRARFEPLLTADESDIGALLYPAFERLCGEAVARAEETLTVGAADQRQADLLGIALGAPVVNVDRKAFGFDGEPIEWRRTHGNAATFQYFIELR